MSALGTNCTGNHSSPLLRCNNVTYLFQIVQGLMGIFVLLSLVYKRHRETPKRPWRIWFVSPSQGRPRGTHYFTRRLFDVSKQVVGQMFVHTANLLAAGLVSHHTDGNACVNYFLNILIDTTFGELQRVPPHLPLQCLISF
jgi:hypothetical protein